MRQTRRDIESDGRASLAQLRENLLRGEPRAPAERHALTDDIRQSLSGRPHTDSITLREPETDE